MSYGGLSIVYLLIFIAQLSGCCCVYSFQLFLPLQPSVRELTRGTFYYYHVRKSLSPAPTPTYRNRRLNSPLPALQAKNDDLNEKGKDLSLQTNEGARSKRPLLHRKGTRRWRYDFFIHQESHLTAAGAESLFSLSWWPFTYINSAESAPSTILHDERRRYYSDVDSFNLPSIDCSWACASNTEQIQLQQMKLLLQSEVKMITDTKLNEKYPDVYSDLRLLRFLRRKSKERDVTGASKAAAAADCYRSFLEWRKRHEVDNIRAMVEDCSGSFTPPDERLQTVAAYFPMNFEYLVQATDGSKNSNEVGDNAVKPAILVNVGEFDARGITEKILTSDSDVTSEDFLNYWVFLYESIHVRLYQQSLQFGQMAFLDEVVCDLSGLSLQRFFSPLFFTKIMSPWVKMMQANYPETTRRLYILNPPAIIKVVWKLVTPLLSQGTLDKIRFVRKVDG
jgi:hypothetical protein